LKIIIEAAIEQKDRQERLEKNEDLKELESGIGPEFEKEISEMIGQKNAKELTELKKSIEDMKNEGCKDFAMDENYWPTVIKRINEIHVIYYIHDET